MSSFFMGTPGRFEQLPSVTPEQKSILDQILSGIGGAGGPLQSGIQNLQQLLSGDPQAFQSFAAPAITRFQQQTVPGIAERFSGGLGIPGASSAQQSSAFGQTLGAAGANLEENLQAQRSGLQSQALQQLQSLLGQGMQPQFQTQQIPGQPGALQGLFQMLGQGFGATGQTALSGGLGGLLSGKGFGTGMRRGFGF